MGVIFNYVYNMRGNTEILKLLSLGLEWKIQCYNRYFVSGYVFYTEDYGEGWNSYNNEVCVKKSTFFEVDYYHKLEETIEL